ncbi:altronate dehydratase family protein [Amphibacillus sp. MSJ-3]|uniref:UxaA family hydrolase n=1 Tax=Amphibacillus sp. MSJ-3 TaxID=2841505 RepID=UPI001C0F2974|nr:altronate dehydratase family protein [Amphibacillus sp. MSJ-3]MBU5594483.1 altronate dehydratase family protein [Amphibacillus sp. MSJ-3]
MRKFKQLHERDNVIVALMPLKQGEVLEVNDQSIKLIEDVPQGHKLAIQPIKEEDHVIKYGYPIGHAIAEIKVGQWVHTHNMKTNLSGIEDYQYNPKSVENPFDRDDRHFYGYKRKNGEVGIRNELWIVPTVGCVNGVAEQILKEFERELGDIAPFEQALVLSHQYGCSQLGDDHENTRQILSDIVHHPNAGGVLVLGLGCENNIVEEFEQHLGDYDKDRVRFLVSQLVSDEVEEGVQKLKEIYQAAKDDHRERLPLSELRIGLKCGGSDGLSGITANPLVGEFSDYLVAQGGTTVLTEVPEMFGAETILMERAENEQVFNKTVEMINDFKAYFIKNEQPVYENPSPGNKDGGITTLEDKSLGCTQKAGTDIVRDVLKYGDRLKKKGLNLLSAPGNDLVAASALAASGCHIVLFTTGRGTPFGTFVPTIKISSNSQIYEKKPHWIDFNAGQLLEKDNTDVLDQFIDYIIDIANGTKSKNELNGYRELAIFKTGVTL